MRSISTYLILVQLLLANSTICYASQAWNYPSNEAVTIVEYYDYGFIGTVFNKTVEPDSTQYVFNVTEYLKHPLKSTEIYLTVGGGSEIAVSPSTSFFLDKEYIICFDELGKNFRIVGYDYTYTLLNSVDAEDIENIRTIKVADASHSEPIKSNLFYTVLICLGRFFAILFSILFLIQYLRARTERTGKGGHHRVYRLDMSWSELKEYFARIVIGKLLTEYPEESRRTISKL